MTAQALVTSFGFRHPLPPPAPLDLQLDLRWMRNPFHDPSLRHRTGLDDAVRTHVLATPGALDLLAAVCSAVLAQARVLPAAPVRVGWGCSGGRHRSVAMACELARLLGSAGLDVGLVHRDIGRPVLPPAAHVQDPR